MGGTLALRIRYQVLVRATWAALILCFGLVTTSLAYTEEQAQQGAKVFASYCSTCHGDRGQGLTDEFRATWPPEDQYCWTPKCHGLNHPNTGFALPRHVPALVGSDTLLDFSDATDLYTFIKTKMPYQDPSLLSDEQRWAVTAFLLREHNVPTDGKPLDATTATMVRLKSEAPQKPLGAEPAGPQASPVPVGISGNVSWLWLIAGSVVFSGGLVLILYFLLSRRPHG
jgi:mono/diheme cytochrome c family protein